jgi:hypothetical protein
MIMIKNNLFTILQNSVISTIAMHSFTLGYHGVKRNKTPKKPYPRLEYLFYVLPIVYHQSSMETFKTSNQLYTALQNNKSIILGLQDRANKMTIQTFDSLNMAFSKNILQYNKKHKTIELAQGYTSKKIVLPSSMMDKDNSVRKIRDCAFKLGAIFAKRNINNIQLELNIRF